MRVIEMVVIRRIHPRHTHGPQQVSGRIQLKQALPGFFDDNDIVLPVDGDPGAVVMRVICLIGDELFAKEDPLPGAAAVVFHYNTVIRARPVDVPARVGFQIVEVICVRHKVRTGAVGQTFADTSRVRDVDIVRVIDRDPVGQIEAARKCGAHPCGAARAALDAVVTPVDYIDTIDRIDRQAVGVAEVRVITALLRRDPDRGMVDRRAGAKGVYLHAVVIRV